jgi:hypothetical protein
MHPSPLAQSSSQLWNGNNGEQNGMDMFPSDSQLPNLAFDGASYGGNPALDSNFYQYEGSQDIGGSLSGFSSSSSTALFATPGLPFRGLDYLRNYSTGAYSPGNDQDSLWQSYDPGVFGYDPDVPFNLGDPQPDNQEGPR